MTFEPIDYPAELERIASAAMKADNPGTVVSADDATVLRAAARYIRLIRERAGKEES